MSVIIGRVRARAGRQRELSLEFKPQDCWIGVFWKRDSFEASHRHGIANPALPAIAQSFDVWVCLLPMLPIHYRKVWR